MTSLAQRIGEREPGDTTVASGPDHVAPPARLGRYELAYVLGRGTYGVVFAAYDPELDRAVAIKVFNDRNAIEACQREAIALARAVHPNVVALHDFVCADGLAFLVMDIVHGGTLRDYMARWHDWREVVRVFIQAARGLAAVHAAGLAHGDTFAPIIPAESFGWRHPGRREPTRYGTQTLRFSVPPPELRQPKPGYA